MGESVRDEPGVRARQALLLWITFIITAIIISGTIPFLLGHDLHAWTDSTPKSVLFHLLIYAGLFLVAPLTLVKGWNVVRQPTFSIPLLLAIVGITARSVLWPDRLLPTAMFVVPVLAFLHWRCDLSGLGFRSKGRGGDALAILLAGAAQLASSLASPAPYTGDIAGASLYALSRMFANPASTTENLFYFGFLTERLSCKTKWATPLLVAAMYTAHEMSNPEYWYGGLQFGFVFVGIALMSALYLWRRSVVVIWLCDGLVRFVGSLF